MISCYENISSVPCMSKQLSDSFYIQSLKKAGLKVTTPRIKVLETLEQENLRHFSAEAVFEALKRSGVNIGIATVYRILTQFESVGLVKKMSFENGYSVYELQTGDHHDHLVCLSCGFVEEFCDEQLESRLRVIEHHKNFSSTRHTLVIYGFCKNCQASK